MLTKKKKPVDPELKQVLHELEDVVQRLGYTMRYEKGNFEGGYCLVKESKLFVINSRYELEKRISIIARNLKELGVDDIFVKPGIREIIDKENESGKKKNKEDNQKEPETSTAEESIASGDRDTHCQSNDDSNDVNDTETG